MPTFRQLFGILRATNIVCDKANNNNNQWLIGINNGLDLKIILHQSHLVEQNYTKEAQSYMLDL